MFLAGQWRNQAAKWESIGTSPTVLSWIQEGVRLPFFVEPEPFELPNKPLSPAQSAFIDTELASLVSSGAIRICSFKPVCVSPIWCVPKKKSFRLVIDYTPNAVVELLPHRHCVGATLIAPYHHRGALFKPIPINLANHRHRTRLLADCQ